MRIFISMLFFSLLSHPSFAEVGDILSMQVTPSGNFNVICSNLANETIEVDDLYEGNVCLKPSIVIKEGTYKVTSGNTSYCDQRLLTTYENSQLKMVTVTWLCSGVTVDYACEKNFCKGHYNGSPANPTIKVLSDSAYEYVGSGGAAVLRWSSNVVKVDSRIQHFGEFKDQK